MTVVASWVREINKAKNLYELVMVSDSRLNSGMYWDECPKIMRFERGDCILGFAGNTAFSYPFMLQMNNIVTEYSKISRGAIGFRDLSGHFVRTINTMTSRIDNQIKGNDEVLMEPYTNEYIFAGFDWKEKRFVINTISCVPHNIGEVKRCGEGEGLIIGKGENKQELTYDHVDRHFEYCVEKKKVVQKGKINFGDFENCFGPIGVIGDKREDFIRILRKILQRKYGENYEKSFGAGFDMEPYDALCALLKEESSNNSSTVGGAPQMVKVYQYMKSGTIGVYWPKRDPNNPYRNRTLLGRKLLEYEETDYWFWDQECNRSFPCRDGMNTYIDMYQGLGIRYLVKEDKIEVQFIKSSEMYFENCHFSIKSNADKLNYNDKYKVVLKFDNSSNYEHVFPMWDLKEYYVPSKEAFEDGVYEMNCKLVDMFEIVNFNYSHDKEYVRPILKIANSEYSPYCEYNIIGDDILTYDQEFSVQLIYNVEGKKEIGMEPLMYIRKYKIPSREGMKKYEIKRYKIQKILRLMNERVVDMVKEGLGSFGE